MQTWEQRFNELLTEQTAALKEVKKASTKEEWINATTLVKKNMDELYDFFNTYDANGSPSHQNEMPDK